MRRDPYFIFDLDGTLIDNVYLHVLAWQKALRNEGLDLPVWRIHRKIGMSGGLLVEQLTRVTGQDIDDARSERARKAHADIYRTLAGDARPLPGAIELLQRLDKMGVAWAIATSGMMQTARPALEMLEIDFDRAVIITRDQVRSAKPAPDLFLKAAEQLGRPIENALVVGDSVWDMLASVRARALGIGVLSGGYADSELREAGAYRVFDEPLDLIAHLDELIQRGAS